MLNYDESLWSELIICQFDFHLGWWHQELQPTASWTNVNMITRRFAKIQVLIEEI